MAYISGFDLGTQSAKLIVLNTDTKEIVFNENYKYPLISKDDGSREQDAEDYKKALYTLLSMVDKSIRQEIISIGVSGQQHGFVPLDKNGNVIAPVKLWCDTSSAQDCLDLEAKLGGKEKVYSLIQNQILPGYTVGKVYKMKREQPELFEKLAHILLPHDYINFILTGRYVTEAGDASGTAYFNIEKKEWNYDVLNAIDSEKDWHSIVPELIQSTEAIGTITDEISKELSLNPNMVVSAGGGDNMMCAIGLGVIENGQVAVSMGTSGTLFGASKQPVIDKKGRLAAFCSSSGVYLPLLCTMNCTIATEEVRALFELDVKELDKIAESAPIGADGVLMLPYFNGERTPNFPNGKGVITGLTTYNLSKANIARASLESAVYSLKTGLNAFTELGFKATEIMLSGGGAKSKIWREMVADVFGLPVKVTTLSENAALGATLQGYTAQSGIPLSTLTKEFIALDENKCVKPNMNNHKKYQEVYKLYKKWEETVTPVFS